MEKMLYKKELVDELFICKNCNTTYVQPVILPCFKKICSDCVNKLSVNEKLNCCFCKKIHEVPLDGFPLDEDLNNLIEKKFKLNYSNKHMEQLDKIVKELEAYSETIEIKGKGLENDLIEYCSLILNKIDTAAEETKEQINKIRDDYIKIINDYKNENLKNMKNNKQKTIDFKVELDRYINELKQHLNDTNMEEQKSKEIFEKAWIKKNRIEKCFENVDLLKFDNKKIEFIRKEDKINEKLLGELDYSIVNINFEFEFIINDQKDFESKLKKTIVSASTDKTLKVWNIETGECIRTLQGHTSDVFCVSVIDKSKIVSGSWDYTLKVWNIVTGECIRTLEGHTNYVYCVSVIDKSNIVSGSEDNTLKVWNIDTGHCIRTLQGHTTHVICVSVIDKSKIVSGSGDNTLKVWNIDTGECIRTLKGHTSHINYVSVIDISKIISGSLDNTLKVWNIDTGKCIRTLEGHASHITSASFIDKSQIISGSRDNTLKVWNIQTGECIRTLQGDPNDVWCVSVIDKSKIVIGGAAKTLKVLNIETGERIRTLEGHTNFINYVSVIDN